MIRVVDPGLLTTVQDVGRWGYQADGVSPSGAMDPISHRIANALVGNDERAATLEITLTGPTLEFERDALVAICGGDISPTVSGLPIHGWRAVYVKRGSTLSSGQAAWGSRAYLAVGGGIDVPLVMGSRSTYLRARIGGFKGRALRHGDLLSIGDQGEVTRRSMGSASSRFGPVPFAITELAVDPTRLGYHEPGRAIRVTYGPHFHDFDDRDRGVLLGAPFTISPRSDRMGYRLSGHLLRSGGGADIVSQAVLHGTIQVPRGGEPIVLMADRQTVGGYPIIAQVVSCDLPTLAQLRPGDSVRFEAVSTKQAQEALARRETKLRSLLKEMSDGAKR